MYQIVTIFLVRQVSERALFLWNNEYIVSMITTNKQTILPIVYAALAKNQKEHWNSTVVGLTYNVQKLLVEMDSQLYDECSEDFQRKEEMKEATILEREQKWV